MRSRPLLLASVLAIVLNYVDVHADDWTQFLGTLYGMSAEKNLINAWPASGPKVVWRTPLGVSMSSVIVSNAQAFTLFQDESDLYARRSGRNNREGTVEDKFATAYENAMGNGRTSNPDSG